MLQRVQTIYLLFAFILMVLLLFFPIFSIEIQGYEELAYLNGNGIVREGKTIGSLPLSYMFIGLALLSALCIFMYEKRPRQLLLTRLNLVLHLLFVVGIYAVYYFGESFVVDGIQRSENVAVSVAFYMEVGFFLLIPTLAFLYLAIRGIKRDENLVNSLDRLR